MRKPFRTMNSDSIELASLNSLQHRLAGDAEQAGSVLHNDISSRAVLDKAATHRIGDMNTPRCDGCELFARDEAIIDPAMERRRDSAQYIGCLANVKQLPFGSFGWRSETGNFPMTAQDDRPEGKLLNIR